MRFVLGNRLLQHAGGTEVHLATLSHELRRLGHEVVLYAPQTGAYAEHLRDQGFEVHGAVTQLPERCDVVLSQDAIVVYDLAARYPDAVHVFRVCGDVYDLQAPPQLPDVVDLVIALSDRYVRLAEAMAVRTPVLRLRVPIDIERLAPLRPIRERPERVVLLGNYPERRELVRDAWGGAGLDVQVVGGSAQRFDVADALADADIVVAKSRAALDAMACARAVYVFDLFGGDGWVTPETYSRLEADNFAGLALDRVMDRETLVRDLADYRQGMGVLNRDLIVQHHAARDHAVELLHAIGEREAAVTRPRDALAELSRISALQWSWERIVREDRHLRWTLREELAQTRAGAAAAQEQAAAHASRAEECDALRVERDAALTERDAARAELADVRGTRAWRLTTTAYRLRARLRPPRS